MELNEAKTIAERYKIRFEHVCEEVIIGGSIRREKKFVKDIELIVVPKRFKVPSKNLFGEQEPIIYYPIKAFCSLVNSLEKIKGSPYGKYTKRKLVDGINLDLFMADETNFGVITFIRTGNVQHVKRVLALLSKQGICCKDGRLHYNKGKKPINVYNERKIYELANINYIPPKHREW